MLDILFIVLVVFVFLIGISRTKEGFETQPDDLYQTEPIKSLTEKLNEYLQALILSIETMLNGIAGNIESNVSDKMGWIKSCVGCVKFCGKEPYWGTCSRTECPSVPCGESCSGTPPSCSTKYCTRCATVNYGCTQWRDKCTPKFPKWKCSPNPSGFNIPSFPTSWTGVSEKNC